MCLAAMRIAGVERGVHAYSNDDGAPFGLSNAWLYGELANPAVELKMKLEQVPRTVSSIWKCFMTTSCPRTMW